MFEAKSSDLPILNAFIEGMGIELETETNCMNIDELNSTGSSDYYLLRYGCAVKLRDFLLIKQNQQRIDSLHLEFGLFQEVKLSPDGKNLAFLFARNEMNRVIRSNILIMDVENFIELELENEIQAFEYPILDYQWVDNGTIQVMIPELEEYSFDQIDKWNHSSEANKQVKQLNIKIKDSSA
ncbi:hypothetical protein [Chengkuizengella axinellae]|uniref:Uncharacterized protein n=1 Tax=Chengkuizengella axinellae TaxID=3064388 RepID=A0ABT9IXF3_9BACL|nr:hypothetical protein [Chengkuizengella sp. 2205SS18-9]MDP5274044.1 hypothetical protein [Chengkuizengella sp. 2205SS18-9]